MPLSPGFSRDIDDLETLAARAGIAVSVPGTIDEDELEFAALDLRQKWLAKTH